MYLIHGTWIPDDADGFLQKGGFYLWVETDRPGELTSSGETVVHPRQLNERDLRAFLEEKLGISVGGGSAAAAFGDKFFLLPSADDAPLPSFEMRPYLDLEIPDAFALRPWQVCCYRVPNVIATLNDVHFQALHAPDAYQLGTDLLFWHRFSRLIKQVIAKDQYIPAVKYREPDAAKDKRSRKEPEHELWRGWEIVSPTCEAAIPRYVAAMPAACRAGSVTPRPDGLYAAESLLRHFAEGLLHDAVAATPFTAKLNQDVAGTLVAACISPTGPAPRLLPASDAAKEYGRWAAWRAKLVPAQTGAGFTLGFRMDETPSRDADHWPVHFLAIARQDPSFRIPLADYWDLSPEGRDDLGPFLGADFEKQLLLALGQAARIYPKIWEGLETARPTGFSLSLDEAYGFLKETAWVLEDAGYAVLVPAWWTPAGRRRAKVRLKTGTRGGKSAAATPGGYFSFDRLVAYEFQLMVGDEVVTEEEWRQLVAAKTPLVQFRGQWMEVDRARMEQLLELWQKSQGADQELTVPELLKRAAESDDDLEWDY
ncbi:MAG TPA: SNF2 helicase-associated domain-containing protein, partial [Chloroflexota bacterium]|nr:SNF2 helicase-associated domain-containing protein [Chloroflexota bacterium]